MYYSLNECRKGLNFFESWPSSMAVTYIDVTVYQNSPIYIYTEIYIYLHRNFVNRSFVIFGKKWNSLQVFYFDFRGERTGDNYFRNQHGVLSVGLSCSYVCGGWCTKRFFVWQRKSNRSNCSNREFFTFS